MCGPGRAARSLSGHAFGGSARCPGSERAADGAPDASIAEPPPNSTADSAAPAHTMHVATTTATNAARPNFSDALDSELMAYNAIETLRSGQHRPDFW